MNPNTKLTKQAAIQKVTYTQLSESLLARVLTATPFGEIQETPSNLLSLDVPLRESYVGADRMILSLLQQSIKPVWYDQLTPKLFVDLNTELKQNGYEVATYVIGANVWASLLNNSEDFRYLLDPVGLIAELNFDRVRPLIGTDIFNDSLKKPSLQQVTWLVGYLLGMDLYSDTFRHPSLRIIGSDDIWALPKLGLGTFAYKDISQDNATSTAMLHVCLNTKAAAWATLKGSK